jgi:hypothetical protein
MKRLWPRGQERLISLIRACPWRVEVNSNSYWSDQTGLTQGQDRPGQLVSNKQELFNT